MPAPFTVRRVALWRDCDPAGVVYAGNFTHYLLDAASEFRRHLFGVDWQSIRQSLGIDTPAKAMSLVFQGSLWPHDAFDVALYVGEIRVRTMDFLARACRADDGGAVFVGRFTSICVSAADRRIAREIPDALRAPAARYREIHPPPQALLEARW
jgi:acyl-CoA thioesterase FadM